MSERKLHVRLRQREWSGGKGENEGRGFLTKTGECDREGSMRGLGGGKERAISPKGCCGLMRYHRSGN